MTHRYDPAPLFHAQMRPPLRLGLVFFDDADARAIRAIVSWMSTERLPWIVVDERPVHAVLLACGTHRRDQDDTLQLRLAADAEFAARWAFGDAMPPITLRKPLQPAHLKLALEMAAASLIPEHVEAFSPHTRPRAPHTVAPRRPATLV
jgi:hypothetical protein